MADRNMRPFQGIFIIMFLIGMGIFIYGGSRFNTDIVLGGFGVCVASIFIPILIGVCISCCKGSTQRNVPVHQVNTMYGTSYPSAVAPNQYSGVGQGQYPRQQYPGSPSQYPAASGLGPGATLGQYPSQYPGVASQYPGVASQYPGVASQYPGVASQYPGVVPAQYAGAVPSQYPGAVPSQYPAAVPSQYPGAVPSQYPAAVPSQYPGAVPSQYPSELQPQPAPNEAQNKPSAPQDPEFLARVPPPSYNEAMNLART